MVEPIQNREGSTTPRPPTVNHPGPDSAPMATRLSILAPRNALLALAQGETTPNWTPTELTERVKRGLGLNHNDGSIVDTSTEPTLAERTAQNSRLANAVYALTLSFPIGKQRDALLVDFPVLNEGITYNVRQKMQSLGEDILPEVRAQTVQTELTALFNALVARVGSTEQAAFFLNYPGLSNDEILSEVRPANENWFGQSLDANAHGPQMGVNINTRLGIQTIEALMTGEARWDDIIFSYLDGEQIGRERDVVARLHAAVREEPRMPVAHEHPHASSPIQDAEFQSLWREQVKAITRIGLFLAQWAEDTNPSLTLPAAGELIVDDPQVFTIDSNHIARLNAFFTNPQFRPYVQTGMELLQASAQFLASEQGKKLLSLQRRQNNSINPPHWFEPEAQGRIEDSVEDAMNKRVNSMRDSQQQMQFPTNLTHIARLLNFEGEVRPEYATPTTVNS